MIYLEKFQTVNREKEELYLNDIRSTCFQTFYPFQVFCYRELTAFSFDAVTVFAGGNGSGKSTLLNIIAEKLGVERRSLFNRSSFFDDYVKMCDYQLSEKSEKSEKRGLPVKSKIITSDDVFDALLDLRCLNEQIDRKREDIFDEYTEMKYANVRLRTLNDIDAFKKNNHARKKTKSQYTRERLMKNPKEYSNGESALRYFTEEIEDHALYLLDEPENSLSAKFQLELAQFIEDSARFYHCQFIIATHSPFLLALPFAKIYDLDVTPPRIKVWTDLANVKIYRDFFKGHEGDFE